jgi:dTDP-D-glucose 4,6-dehydratase
MSDSYLIVGGFTPLGAAFVKYLLEKHSSKVVVYDVGGTSLETPQNAAASVVLGDMKNEALIQTTIEKYQITKVLYFPRGLCDSLCQEKDPVKSANEIVLGVTHLLEAIRKCPTVKCFVQLSTLEVCGPHLSDQQYGKRQPQTAFASALMGAEAMIHAYAMSYRINSKIARVPETLRWFACRNDITEQGNGLIRFLFFS